MYLINENGEPYLDQVMSDAYDEARRNRQASPRATAVLSSSMQHLGPRAFIPQAYWDQHLRLGNQALTEIVRDTGTGAPRQRDAQANFLPSDINSVFQRLFLRFVKQEMQGFTGPDPLYVGNSFRTWSVVLPADGAVLRYLSRVSRLTNGWISVQAYALREHENVSSIGGCNLTLSHLHCMRIEVNFHSGITSHVPPSGSGLLRFLRTLVEFRALMPGIRKALQTLSRKVISVDGSYGELPKFPIVNAYQKLSRHGWSLDESTRNRFSGNNQTLFADKAVYDVIAFGDKVPVLRSTGQSGEYQWIQPSR